MSTETQAKDGPVLLVLAATAGEARTVARAIRRSGRGAEIRLERIGMGPARARSRTRALLEEGVPEAVLLVGFAGGLAPGLGVGDVVLPIAHRDASGAELETAADLTGVLASALDASELVAHRGAFLTSERVLARPEEKREAHAAGSLAVEMEGFAVAQALEGRAGRFASLRTVLDPVDHRLPDLEHAMDGAGRPRVRLLPRAVLRRPGLLLEGMRFAIVLPGAHRALRRAVEAVLPALLDALTLKAEGRGHILPEART